MLFTLDDAVESMERESLDVGITSVLEALDHTTGTLRNIVVPSGRVWFGPASCPFLPLYFLYPNYRLSAVPYSSQPGEISVSLSTEGSPRLPH